MSAAPRFRLIDGPLLSRLMRCPDTGGRRHTARSLATETGISKSKINSMIHDRQTRVTEEQADRIAKAVGVTRKALFAPCLSALADTDNGGEQ